MEKVWEGRAQVWGQLAEGKSSVEQSVWIGAGWRKCGGHAMEHVNCRGTTLMRRPERLRGVQTFQQLHLPITHCQLPHVVAAYLLATRAPAVHDMAAAAAGLPPNFTLAVAHCPLLTAILKQARPQPPHQRCIWR